MITMSHNIGRILTEKDKRMHFWAGMSIVMIVFALLTRFPQAIWLLIPAAIWPVVWEILTHPDRRWNFTEEDKLDIQASWLGVMSGFVVGLLIFYDMAIKAAGG